jgi:4-hydroxybenzoate polyprenyltransferase
MTTDIKATSLWQRIPFLYPYALLGRWDRPIGIWLLFWPCAWGLLLAPTFKILLPEQQIYFLGLFFMGAILLRGAGCTLNDILDRKLDAQVERTKYRPLPSGQLSVLNAFIFLLLQLSAGLWVFLQLSPLAMILSAAAVPLVALYPMMKRITYWPQLFLGLVFNSGVLIAWATLENNITLTPLIFYLAGVLWTLAYDSVYAFLDSQDDVKIGVKSTIQLWGMASKSIIGWLWLASGICFFVGMLLIPIQGTIPYIMVVGTVVLNLTGHCFWNITNDKFSLGFFRLQARVGLLLAMALAAPILL